ncbi:MAG: hypothetical protein CMB99_16475 [Flavobacteriaceae bacterium]|jgi:FkbM family methyltransferase|nr:hypothetical protein [Flavobacteriaceae bacterium]|tara:strand:+ start:1019 stop:1672 length:654 start_codon:yes stop_codon:yes gene_type:complete
MAKAQKDWQREWTRKDLEKVNGFLWPSHAAKYQERYTKHAPDMAEAIKFCDQTRQVIQAGGNCGVWARWLADKFDAIYTFEPDGMNFFCLSYNCPHPNIFKMQAALDEEPGPVALNYHNNNIGAHNLIGPGSIPAITIDSLGLEALDLLVLDVEGWEWPALRGATETLRKCKPVLQLEHRGHGEKLGHGSEEDMVAWLDEEFGYELAAKVAKDIILI